MGLLSITEFSLSAAIQDVYYIKCVEPVPSITSHPGPGRQVCIEFNRKEFSIDNFPTPSQILTMVADELQNQYGCTVTYEFEKDFNPKLSWRPIHIPYIRAWLPGTTQVIIYISTRPARCQF